SWTTSQSVVFIRDSGQQYDLSLLTKSRRPAELALEQGILAGMTPLRDMAGLADNLPLLVFATIVLFRASLDLTGWESPLEQGLGAPGARMRMGWLTLTWGIALLYALYRVVEWGAGGNDLPRGGYLIVEVLLVPMLMMVSDGFLLAWVLTELRTAGFD